MAKALNITITGDAKGFSDATKQAEKDVDHLEKSTASATAKMGSSMSGFSAKAKTAMVAAGAATAGLGVALIGAGDKATDFGMNISKLERLTGGTAEQMSTFAFAAQQTGLDVDALGKGIRRMSVNMEDNKKLFDGLGIATRDANGHLRDSYDVMADVADKFKDMEDGAEKTALAQKIFGRSGADLIPFLNGGREGLAAYKAEAAQLGLVVGQDFVDQARKAKAAKRDLDAAWDALIIKVGTPVMVWIGDHLPGIIDTIKGKIDEAKAAWDLLNRDFGGGPGEGKQSTLGSFLDQQKENGPLSGIAQTINPTGQNPVDQWMEGSNRISDWLGEVKTKFGEMGASAAASFEDLKHGFSIVGETIAPFVEIVRGLGASILNTIAPLGASVMQIFGGLAQGLGSLFSGIWNGLTTAASAAWDMVKNVFNDALGAIRGAMSAGLALLKGDWEGVWNGIRDFLSNIGKSIIDTFVGIGGSVWAGIKGAAQMVAGALNGLIDVWNSLNIPAIHVDLPFGKSFDTPKIDFPDLPHIPKFHGGGVFQAPTPGGEGLALLKDGEYVIPEDSPLWNPYTMGNHIAGPGYDGPFRPPPGYVAPAMGAMDPVGYSSGANGQTIQIVLDGRVLATAMVNHLRSYEREIR